MALPGQQRPGMRISPVLRALDADRNGELSAAEIQNAAAALQKLDTNLDKQLNAEEFLEPQGDRRPLPGMRGGADGGARSGDLVQTLMAFDADGDGKLSKSELPERMQGLFARADSDKDGLLTQAELEKATETQQSREGGMQPGGAERGRGREEGFRTSRGGPMRDPLVSALDGDRDGILSAGEISNAPAALRSLDKNGDGRIAEDEIRPAFPQGGGRRGGVGEGRRIGE